MRPPRRRQEPTGTQRHAWRRKMRSCTQANFSQARKIKPPGRQPNAPIKSDTTAKDNLFPKPARFLVYADRASNCLTRSSQMDVSSRLSASCRVESTCELYARARYDHSLPPPFSESPLPPSSKKKDDLEFQLPPQRVDVGLGLLGLDRQELDLRLVLLAHRADLDVGPAPPTATTPTATVSNDPLVCAAVSRHARGNLRLGVRFQRIVAAVLRGERFLGGAQRLLQLLLVVLEVVCKAGVGG